MQLKKLGYGSFLALSTYATAMAEGGTLTVNVDTKVAEGVVLVGVFDSQAGFENKMAITGKRVPAKKQGTQLIFEDLEPGRYGIALFHDVNQDYKLNQLDNLIPSEPYGFSNNPEIKDAAPTFEAFSFTLGQKPIVLSVTLVEP